ncbi:MAG: pentapeptide repeat-containing protein [Cyanobacteria bacterium J06633_8]
MNSQTMLALSQKSLLLIIVSASLLLAISALTIFLIRFFKSKQREQKIASAWRIVLSTKASQDERNCIEAIEYLNQLSQDLSCLNLASYFLEGVQLQEANLSCANLSKTKLSGADFTNANLVEANLSGADLSSAKE